MRLTLLVLAPLLSFAACQVVQPAEPVEPEVQSHTADLLAGTTWRWVESYDPYQGGTWYRPEAGSAGHTFVFAADGTFVEDRPGGCCRQEGRWEYADDGAQLALDYPEAADLTYGLHTLTPDTLRLTIRGRHGTVVETYTAGTR